jgi:SAM-dependent methyltransferase
MTALALPPLPSTDPQALYRWRDGLYAADLLTAALVGLDLFTRLDARPSTLEAICRDLGIHVRPADVMLTLFTAMDLVSRDGEVFHVTTQAREHLVAASPYFLGPYYASFADRPVCRDLLTVLRTGKPANWAGTAGGSDWATAMADEGFARRFTAAMDCRGVYLGQRAAAAVDLRTHRALLDIAGGSGVYACAFAARYPHLRASVFEKPPVDLVARRAIDERGFGDRVGVVAGDMLAEPLPRGYDVHLISNVMHDWDVPRVRALLTSSFAALEPGGLLIVHDAHLDADKRGPLAVAAYSVMLMHSTEGRCYSTAEMDSLMRDAGFAPARVIPNAADRSLVCAGKP